VSDYAARMSDEWNEGSTVDISHEMMRLTLRIICKSVLNYDVESEAQQVGKALTTFRKYSKRLQSPIGQVLDKISVLPAPKKAREAKNELDSLVYGLISDRRKQEESGSNMRHNDLLTRLLVWIAWVSLFPHELLFGYVAFNKRLRNYFIITAKEN
jgi:cytochrome P450